MHFSFLAGYNPPIRTDGTKIIICQLAPSFIIPLLRSGFNMLTTARLNGVWHHSEIKDGWNIAYCKDQFKSDEAVEEYNG